MGESKITKEGKEGIEKGNEVGEDLNSGKRKTYLELKRDD